MVIRKDEDDGRSIQRVGPLLCEVRPVPDAKEGDDPVQEGPPEAPVQGGSSEGAVYNRTEEGQELIYAGDARKGRYKLTELDVIRIRRNEERLTIAEWAKLLATSYHVIWSATKGYTYKALNWRAPPRY